MAELNIPGVSDKFKTNELIKGLMEVERVPLKREQKRLEDFKTEQDIWRSLNGYMGSLRETVRLLYSYDNPFNSKLSESSDEYSVTAEPGRDAALDSFKIEVIKTATADRFLSAELPEDTTVPSGNYEYSVGNKKVSFNWKGGKIDDFVSALNRRGNKVIRASLIGITKNSKSLLIESLISGKENPLIFGNQAMDFAINTKMIAPKPVATVDSMVLSNQTIKKNNETPFNPITINETAVTVGKNSGFELDVPQSIANNKNAEIRFTAHLNSSKTAQGEVAREPVLPETGGINFKGISVQNEEVNTLLPPAEIPEPVIPVEDYNVFFVKTRDNIEIPLLPVLDSKESTYVIKTADYPDIKSLIVKNKNTEKQLHISTLKTIDNSAKVNYEPLNAVSKADDATIKYRGITISRDSNTIDDVIPQITLNLHEPNTKPVTIKIKPDIESAKESLITFVGKYNRLIAEINILTQTKPEIITELEYFTDDETEKAKENLGKFQAEFSLTNTKSALQRIITNRYATTDDEAISMLSQIGISSNASSGLTGVAAGRLRGYLEIDEKKLDNALDNDMLSIKNLFGQDKDGDLVIDSGIAYLMDKNLQSFTQVGGIIASKNSSLDRKIASSQKSIDNLESKLEKKEVDLKRKYGQMEAALNSLESQADSITNFSNNNNSN